MRPLAASLQGPTGVPERAAAEAEAVERIDGGGAPRRRLPDEGMAEAGATNAPDRKPGAEV
jgi:hypothetical protein